MSSNGLWNGKSLERLHGIQNRKDSIDRMLAEAARLSREAEEEYDQELCALLGIEEAGIMRRSTACEGSPDGHCVTDLALGGSNECLICKHPVP